MPKQKLIMIICSFLATSLFSSLALAQVGSDGLGQTIQINTRLRSFVGKPSWLLIIRDVDHDQNIPYLFEFTKGQDFWLAFTYGRDYLIQASRLQIESYQARYNTFKNYRINNFCHIESMGRIAKGESMIITITGDLSPNDNTYRCHVMKYSDSNFVIVPSNA